MSKSTGAYKPALRILMTGATQGIGLEAAKALLALPGTELHIGARNAKQAPALLRSRAKLHELDLASLASVRAFAAEAQAQAPFDILLLNAGLQSPRRVLSKDGFEMTFAVNHLAHYLLARTLSGGLATNGRVILTASGTHDPEEKTGLPAPRHADAMMLAYPSRDPDVSKSPLRAGQFAYTSSKLCNILTARELSKRTAAARADLAIAAFDPGFTPGTGLARSYPGPIGWIFRYILPLFISGQRVSTPRNSGGLLADLASSPAYSNARGTYFAVRGKQAPETQPSVLARDDAVAAKLWDDSARLVGLA